MANVDVVVDTGWAAVVASDKSIGTEGAFGTCVAVAGLMTDSRHFVAHISFGRSATEELCNVFWNGLEKAGIRFRELRWSAPSHLAKRPPTSIMIAVMTKIFPHRLKEITDGEAGSLYITSDGEFKQLINFNDSLTGESDSHSIRAQIGH